MKNGSLYAVAFRRGFFVPRADYMKAYPEQTALSLQAELMKLGFVLSADAYSKLVLMPEEDIISYYEEIIPVAKEMVGAKRSYKPFYVNFPQQVMDMSQFDLFMNAIIHYWSNGTWEPDQELENRGIKFEKTEFKKIELTDEQKFKKIFAKLVGINSALTPEDRELVGWFVEAYGDSLEMPSSIPFKETLCLLATHGLNVPARTPTDVLRIAVGISGGDISLPGVPKPIVPRSLRMDGWRQQVANSITTKVEERKKFQFKHFRRPERRYLLGLLEKTSLDLGEMQQRLERWLRLGEILHPGEQRKEFPKTFSAFKTLRNQPPKIRTFASQVNMAFIQVDFGKQDLQTALDLLAQRPGEYARKLDWMLRTYASSINLGQILGKLEVIAPRVSSKVLFELYDHLQRRRKKSVRYVALKKGSKMKTLVDLPPLDEGAVDVAQRILKTAIARSFSNLPELGSVWIDPRLKSVPLPTAMRNMNTAIKTYVRGTHIPFRSEAKVIRPFIHWYDKDGIQDLDLSAGFLDADFKSVEHLSYTNLKSKLLNSVHSGDIRHRKGSCAEYVDIDLNACLKRGLRYVTIHVYNFNARSMHSLDEVFFGLMEREHPGSNEIFEPRTASNVMGLANESSGVMVCAIDLIDRCYIWLDVEADRQLAFYENTKTQTEETIRAIIEGGRMTVYDLLEMHANARGTVAKDVQSAKTLFAWEDFVTDYAKTAEYMKFG